MSPNALPTTAAIVDFGDGGWVRHVPGWYAEHEAMIPVLLETLPLRQERITVFGRQYDTPRLVSWHGDPECSYRYSGRRFTPAPWTAALDELRERVDEAAGYRFNSVLVNVYRDGRDAMGAHRDDEPELGPTRDDVGIASLSLGARRRFLLEHEPSRRRLEWNLGAGDLLVMGGTTQRTSKHWVPRTNRAVGLRVNLTFRVVLPGHR